MQIIIIPCENGFIVDNQTPHCPGKTSPLFVTTTISEALHYIGGIMAEFEISKMKSATKSASTMQ